MFWAAMIALIGAHAMTSGAPAGLTISVTIVLAFIALVRRDYKRIMKKYYEEDY